MSEIKIPARVQALAEKAGGNPIAWNGKADGSIVIVFEDGRKLTFEPEPMQARKSDPAETAEIEPITPKRKAKNE